MSRLFNQDQDQDLAPQTKTKTTFFVLNESQDQDPKSRDCISGCAMLACSWWRDSKNGTVMAISQ